MVPQSSSRTDDAHRHSIFRYSVTLSGLHPGLKYCPSTANLGAFF
jgi:hypothetical protein